MSAAERGLRLLTYLGATRTPQRHGDLVRALGIPRSTLTDLLADLVDSQHVTLVGRRFALGPATVALAHEIVGGSDLAVVLAGPLRALADATRETAVLMVELAGEGLMVPVAQAEGTSSVRFVAEIGRPFPMINAPSGHVLLAFTGRTTADLPPAAVAGVPDVPRPDLLGAELRRIRVRGYALSRRQESGHSSLAAPVIDVEGRSVAAVSLIGPVGRIRGRQTFLAKQLLDVVGQVRPYVPYAAATARPGRQAGMWRPPSTTST